MPVLHPSCIGQQTEEETMGTTSAAQDGQTKEQIIWHLRQAKLAQVAGSSWTIQMELQMTDSHNPGTASVQACDTIT